MHPMADGFALHSEREQVVLLLHGWTGTPAQLRPLADAIAAAGYGVVAPLLAGHGTHIDDILTTTWRDWVRSALEAVNDVGDDRTLHVAGLSMGALIGILIAATGEVASLTSINAPIKVHDRMFRISGAVRGRSYIRRGDPAVHPVGYATEYHHDYGDTPVGTVAELRDLIRGARRALPRITAPTLVVQSRRDRTVRPESGQIIHDTLTAPRRLLWLEHSGHVATLDVERHLLGAEVVTHLDAASGRKPAAT